VPLAAGAAQWDVRAWNSGSGNGPWSAIRNFTIVAPSSAPPAPTLVSPSGSVASERPVIVWNTVPTSSWYQLWIRDGSGAVTVDRWFTSAEVGCFSGEATCSMASPVMLAAGAGIWYIRTWNAAGFGQWSPGRTFSITRSAPAVPTLRTPAGTIPTNRPIYTWNAVLNATWYLLWVRDASGAVVESWYTTAQADCASGTGVCTLASPPLATGEAVWYVRSWNATGYGPWSAAKAFSVTIPSSPPLAVDTLLWPYGPSLKQPAFSWSPRSTATWYRVRMLNGSGAVILDQWFEAAGLGCSSGEPICSITPAVTLTAGSFHWDVQTWNASGYGSWSPAHAFSVLGP
jgi:hypothetical protein